MDALLVLPSFSDNVRNRYLNADDADKVPVLQAWLGVMFPHNVWEKLLGSPGQTKREIARSERNIDSWFFLWNGNTFDLYPAGVGKSETDEDDRGGMVSWPLYEQPSGFAYVPRQ